MIMCVILYALYVYVSVKLTSHILIGVGWLVILSAHSNLWLTLAIPCRTISSRPSFTGVQRYCASYVCKFVRGMYDVYSWKVMYILGAIYCIAASHTVSRIEYYNNIWVIYYWLCTLYSRIQWYDIKNLRIMTRFFFFFVSYYYISMPLKRGSLYSEGQKLLLVPRCPLVRRSILHNYRLLFASQLYL